MEELKNQNIILEGRNQLKITGVNEVETFDDNGIVLITELGTLSVKGNNVKIEKLNIDSKEVEATGEFYLFEYLNDEHHKHSVFSRMFR